MGQIVGLMTLTDKLIFKKEVLGREYRSHYKGINLDVLFPRFVELDFEKYERQLQPPECFSNVTRGGELLDWGYVQEYPKGNSYVNILGFKFGVDENDKDAVQVIHDSMPIWESKFCQYAYLITKDANFYNVYSDAPLAGIELLNYPLFTPVRNEYPRPIIFSIKIKGDDAAISDEVMKEILEMIANDKELKLEYQLLLEAYKSRKFQEYRQATIDASSAFEICLIRLIKSVCHKTGENSDKYLLNQSLGKIVNHLKTLQIETSNKVIQEYSNNIVKLRNDVAHTRSLYPMVDDVDKLIEEVRLFLRRYSPKFLED